MPILRSFAAGFLSTLIFHQGMHSLFWWLGLATKAPFSLTRTWPLHVPQVISLAFWGGVWAIALWYLLRRVFGARYWLGWLIAGAIGPSIVALCIVFPLKGAPFAGGWDPRLIAAALILNGAWGIGCAILLRLLPTRRA